MATEPMGRHRGGSAEGDGAGVPAGRSATMHHVVVRQGDKGLEVLRMPLEGKGEGLPVFTAGWAARGYLLAEEAPGRGWRVRACPPRELFSLLLGPCAGVEWVALDPRPDRRGGGDRANVMPRENFVHYLSCASPPFLLRPSGLETARGAPRTSEKTIGSARHGSAPFTHRRSKNDAERKKSPDPTRRTSIVRERRRDHS
jgi:hypothetical protein